MKKNLSSKVINKAVFEHKNVIDALVHESSHSISKFCNLTLERLKAGGKIFFIGNGGSAADCQHLAAEFIGRFKNKRRPLPALALTTDTSVLTALGNDYGFEQIFERQLIALCNSKDIIVGISTSGNSKNVINAIIQAKKENIFTVGLSGDSGGELVKIVDLAITVPSQTVARIQEAHLLIGHILCEFCDEHFAFHN